MSKTTPFKLPAVRPIAVEAEAWIGNTAFGRPAEKTDARPRREASPLDHRSARRVTRPI